MDRAPSFPDRTGLNFGIHDGSRHLFLFFIRPCPRSKSITPRSEVEITPVPYRPRGFKMAAAFQKLRFAWSFRAVFAGREFVISTLHQAKTTNRATTHIRKGVCLEWLSCFFCLSKVPTSYLLFTSLTSTRCTTLVLQIFYRLKVFNLG